MINQTVAAPTVDQYLENVGWQAFRRLAMMTQTVAAFIRCKCNGGEMNQKYWGNIRKSRTNKALTDFLRKKISEEDYERIRKQTYGEYVEELRRDAREFLSTKSTWKNSEQQEVSRSPLS